MTYDRAIVKPDLERMAAANRRAVPPAAEDQDDLADLGGTRRTTGITRSPNRQTVGKSPISTIRPGRPARPASAPTARPAPWCGPSGKPPTSGCAARSTWPTTNSASPSLLMHHDDDAEVYINGVLAAKATGYTGRYEPFTIRDEARRTLHAGKNTIAVHCHQNCGRPIYRRGIGGFGGGEVRGFQISNLRFEIARGTGFPFIDDCCKPMRLCESPFLMSRTTESRFAPQ